MIRSLKAWTILSLIGLTSGLLCSTIGNAAIAQSVWLQETSSDSCGKGILKSFELGQGKRWQLTNSPLKSELKSVVSKLQLKDDEVLAFIEGSTSASLDKDIRILKSMDTRHLVAGSMKKIKSIHETALMYIQIMDISKLEPQTCIESEDLSNWELGNKEDPFKQHDMRRPSLALVPLTIDGEFLSKSLREFSGDIARPAGRIQERGSVKGRAAGQAYLKEQFASIGLQVEEQCFTSGGYKGCNIVGTLPGTTESVVVVSAHSDSMTNAGADDDGSGISALISIAKAMKSRTWKSTIQFVGFDLEEKGLIGSKAYVKELVKLKKTVKGNVNLEMLGYDSDNDGGFHVIDCQRKESESLVKLVKQSAAQYKSLKVSPHCTNRSDHASFWNAGIAAVVISENFFDGDGNPCYHQSCDKFDKINANYYLNLVNLAGSVVAQYSESN